DYTSNVGGIQACVEHEARSLKESGFDYLYLHPVLPLPMLATSGNTSVRSILNGHPLPPIRTEQLAEFVGGLLLVSEPSPVRTVIHGMLGHDPVALASQLARLDCNIDYWAHDYTAACSSHTLMRNNVGFCGAPAVNSMACRVCTHGSVRAPHVAAMTELLRTARMTVIAPSKSAALQWRSATH